MIARAAAAADAAEIARIYNQGIEERIATFETRPRNAEEVAAWLSFPRKRNCWNTFFGA